MYIQWTNSYNIGVPRIDEQHQQLIEMINALYQKIGPNTQPHEVWELLEGFNNYAATHFATEERIAREANIDHGEFTAHKAKHQSYRERMLGFRRNLNEGDKRAAMQLMAFLSTWWSQHILQEDMALGQMIQAGAAANHG